MNQQSNIKPPVFIFEFISNGYGLARTFHQAGIEVVGFIIDTKNIEMQSRIPSKIVTLSGSGDDYFVILKQTALLYPSVKPVLIVTSDRHHLFVSTYYEQLKEIFSFEIPRFNDLRKYLEKDLFNEVAREHNILIPSSVEVTPSDFIDKLADAMPPFPVIVKPKYRDQQWLDHYNDCKALVAESKEELISLCETIFPIANRLVIQEWIPGPDSNIFFCLAYITPDGQVLDYFCGQKINQYPILLGNSSSAMPANNAKVVHEALRIMTLPGIFGFCSVEFKRHFFTGDYYVIEPTIGRVNRQEFCASLNDNHLVLKAYCHLAGLPFEEPPKKKKRDCFYMEEHKELRAIFEHRLYGAFNWKEYWHLLRKQRIGFMYINATDPMISIRILKLVFRIAIKEFVSTRASRPKPSSTILKLIKTYQP